MSCNNLPYLLSKLADYNDNKFILLCDDLSFDAGENTYKSLKSVLDGGIEGKPDNIIFYATSNRRHLMPRDMIENERSTSINPSEAVEEKVKRNLSVKQRDAREKLSSKPNVIFCIIITRIYFDDF